MSAYKPKFTSGSQWADERQWAWWTLYLLSAVIACGFWVFVIAIALAFYILLFFIMAGLPDFL